MNTLLIFAGLLFAAMLIEPLAGRLHLPFSAALVAGALVSPTDPPGGITSLCRRLRLGARLPTLIEGESLFNDATAIVLFALLLNLATMSGETPGLAATALEFIRVFAAERRRASRWARWVY